MNFFNDHEGKSLNILLLGETGAGKSTSINSFANYIKYPSFEEAVNHDFIQLIPSNFMLGDEDGNMVRISSSGEDVASVNERMESGKSSTISPCSYLFKLNKTEVRLIDTPGIGDTDGVDHDKENFDKVLSYLHMTKKLHGIVILLKTTETRLTDYFKYCITELLTQLHQDACKNIVFCFTFSRNSHYRAGDAFFMLKNFLREELGMVKLELKAMENCFFIDNEAYRFLLAKKCKYSFPSDQIDDYKNSWNNSVDQTNTMLNFIAGLTPHDLDNTISLNNSRKFIYQMAEPIVDLNMLLEVNIAHIEDQEKELQDVTKNKLNLARNLNIEIDDLETEEVKYPTTVCTAEKCTDRIFKENGEEVVNYKTRCHENCQLLGVTTNLTGHPELANCWAMNGTGKCFQKCGCPFEFHRHITYVTKIVKKSIINQNQQLRIDSEEKAIETIKETIKKTKQIKEEMEKEIKIIQEISAKFAYFLLKYSNTPYNKFLEPYLHLLIRQEEKKIGNNKDYSTAKIDSLQKILKTHQEQIKILTKAIDSKSKSQKDIDIEETINSQKQLFSLKHTGSKFQKIFNISNKHTAKKRANFDKPVDIVPANLKNIGSMCTFV